MSVIHTVTSCQAVNEPLNKSDKTARYHYLANHAVQALLDEVSLTPKPALVDRRGNGAHHDLTFEIMVASAKSLYPAFFAMAQKANEYKSICSALRMAIGKIGRNAETEMLRITGGVNTHRGAIWTLGLLVTSASLLLSHHNRMISLASKEVCQIAGGIACIEDSSITTKKETLSHGELIWQKYQIGGARQQAQQGFPMIVEQGLPRLRYSRYQGDLEEHARLNALLAIMSELGDTCVLHRSGIDGLHVMQDGAKQLLALGGFGNPLARKLYQDYEQKLLVLRASAGGAADLLAGTLFVDWISS
ncbi:MAG: triphosphoribosyl-dephospho-CoA synthase [Moraxella sp.]|nr:triphosphoribosyl-dephospho-CoA synthase [Moraxella sp.]